MIQSFGNKLALALFNGETTKETRRFPPDCHRSALRKLLILDRVQRLDELSIPAGNRLKQLEGDWANYWSMRINDQWRMVFQWTDQGPDDVYILDYH